MKNILLFTILALVTISACEKDNEDGKPEEIFKYHSILAGDNTFPGMVYNDIPDTTIYSSGDGWAGSFSYSADISFDINNDGVSDIAFEVYAGGGLAGYSTGSSVGGLNGTLIIKDDDKNSPKVIAADEVISYTDSTIINRGYCSSFWCYIDGDSGSNGIWLGQSNKYIGFFIPTEKDTLMGWVKLDHGSFGSRFTLKEYAYVTFSNK